MKICILLPASNRVTSSRQNACTDRIVSKRCHATQPANTIDSHASSRPALQQSAGRLLLLASRCVTTDARPVQSSPELPTSLVIHTWSENSPWTRPSDIPLASTRPLLIRKRTCWRCQLRVRLRVNLRLGLGIGLSVSYTSN